MIDKISSQLCRVIFIRRKYYVDFRVIVLYNADYNVTVHIAWLYAVHKSILYVIERQCLILSLSDEQCPVLLS